MSTRPDPADPADPADPTDARALAREAAEALAHAKQLPLPAAREELRRTLARAIERGEAALGLALAGANDAATVASARATLVHAHAARAEDARHGAGQLSLGAQRAPTPEDCDDGWERVEEIVQVAEASARAAARIAGGLDRPAAHEAARAAEASARAARRIVDERNHAYTFHADPGFSFGEGWYLAAAAVLAGVAIQVEPSKPQTAAAERFLRDAGLAARVQPYRSRPRANKPLTAIIAAAFRADPHAAQRRVRAAFLDDAPVPPDIVDWAARALTAAPAGPKVLLWVRHGAHHPDRNTRYPELALLVARARAADLVPVLIGDAVGGGDMPPGAIDLTLFWKQPLFQGEGMRRAQLQLFEQLRRAHGLVGQLGVTTAGMDGPALLGLPTVYLTAAPNPRIGAWVGAVPGYQEVVRDDDYLARIDAVLRAWRDGA
ncbi:MAG TPA: hypothetical protein VM261_26335 [Kofleriaceae bacterium]|nr:hypothetical protein [Kofleriaceae bacterium]